MDFHLYFSISLSYTQEVFCLCGYVCIVYAWYLQTPEEGIGPFGTKVTDSCEPLYRCWELNSGLAQEQEVFFTGEPASQVPLTHF